MGPAPPGICCKLYAFFNLVKFSSIGVCSTNLIVCGRHLRPSHHNSAPLALQQPRLTMTATKSSFPAITSPEATQEDDNEKDSILLVSTSCENGKKAPVFIRKLSLSHRRTPFRDNTGFTCCYINCGTVHLRILCYTTIVQWNQNLTLVFATPQLRIPPTTRHHSLYNDFSSILGFSRVRERRARTNEILVFATASKQSGEVEA